MGCVVTKATTGAKTDLPLKDAPKRAIQDQAVTRPREALENVAGVQDGGDDFESCVP